MACIENVVEALLPLREAADALVAAYCGKSLIPSGKKLVCVGLMAYIKNDLISWRREYPMLGNGEFYRTEIRSQMASVLPDHLSDPFPNLLTQQRKLLLRNVLQIFWGVDFF